MAIQAWGTLGSDDFKPPGSKPEEGGCNTPHMNLGREESVSKVLDAVAKRHSVPITRVALAYALHKTPYLFPIVGGRKASHLKDNIEVLSLQLTPEDIVEIETGYAFDLGFPHNFLNMADFAPEGPQDVTILKSLGHFDYMAPPAAIKPHQGDLSTPWKKA